MPQPATIGSPKNSMLDLSDLTGAVTKVSQNGLVCSLGVPAVAPNESAEAATKVWLDGLVCSLGVLMLASDGSTE